MERNSWIKLALGGVVLASAATAGLVLNDKANDRIASGVALNYIAQPKFSSADFLKQVTGTDAKLEIYNLREGMVYFSIEGGDDDFDKGVLDRLTTNPGNVEFGKPEGRRLVLGKYSFGKPGGYFFRFPAKEFKADSDKLLNFNFGDVSYGITLEELGDFMHNKSVYCGELHAVIDVDRWGRPIIVANHGVMVGEKNEPSLSRLVDDLTSDATGGEETAQILLDFVTGNIEYDDTASIGRAELLKRPNEVLMTGEGDCSGKTILYASLLEQTDLEYRIAYSRGHISVVVAGDFADENGHSIEFDGTRFHLAETTSRGFIIGKDKLIGVGDVRHLQKPGKDSKLIDVMSGKAVEFK